MNSKHVCDRAFPRFAITSLPRSGSTSLASLLNCHPNVRCLIEPFHPQRYDGKFHALAVDELSLDAILDRIFVGCTGIKHVWQSNGWPFLERPDLNLHLTVRPDLRVIFIIRRNLLRRLVSNLISRQTRYWIGTKERFLERLDEVTLSRLDPDAVIRQIQEDRRAVEVQLNHLSNHKAKARILYYEDIFDTDDVQIDRLGFTNDLLGFLGLAPVPQDRFESEWIRWLDPAARWASEGVYRRIANIDEIEREAGCDETGWLFR